MAITEFKIVQGVPSALNDEATLAIADGYQPFGAALLLDNGALAQPFVKGVPDEGTPPDSVVLANGGTVAVVNSAGADSHNATASVTGTTLTNVALAATVAFADNGDTIAVRNSAGADSHNATAVVAAGVITGVNLAATVALVDNSDAITMQNSAGAAIAGTHAATVAAGVLSNVKLAATVAPVVNGQALTGVTPSGVYTNTVTFTVANGVITAIALS